jgi:serine-type D-Ala-D-Ala carboxypeptidase/endopeptidase
MIRSAPLFVALLPSALLSQQHAGIPEEVRANVHARVEAGTWPSLVIGIVDQQGKRYFAYGSTRAEGRAVDEHTVYEIGSVTKVFTSLALADMAVRGELDLDASLQELLPPEVKVPTRNGKPITPRLLAAQRSGLPRMPENFAPSDSTNPYADYDATRLFNFLSGYSLSHDPGERYEYSNLGLGLLGVVLARHDRASYEAMIQRRVLGPLGMSSTMIRLTPAARARLATGHAGDRPVANWDFDAFAGAGAIRSDAEDMLRFVAAAAGISGTPLDSAFRLSETRQFDAGSPTMSIGMGWHILQRPTERIIWHNGGTGGYRSFVGFDPARRVGVVVLANSSLSVDDVGYHLLDSTMALVVPRVAITLAADSREAYVGRFQLAPSFILTITREGSSLYLQATGQPRFGIFASKRDEFFLREVQAEISFERDGQGLVNALVLHQNGANQRAPRVKE